MRSRVVLAVVTVSAVLIGGCGGGQALTTGQNPERPRVAALPPRPAIPGKVVSQINLETPSGGRPAEGVAWIYKAAGRYFIAISASGLKPITLKSGYGVWLAHGRNSVRMLGFVSHGYSPNGSLLEFAPNGRLVVEAGLPADPGRYHQLLITIEAHPHVDYPGLVVLDAPFSL